MVDVTQITKAYHRYKRPTPLSAAFLDARNVLFIRDTVEASVRQHFNNPFIVVVTDELVEKLASALDHNPIYAYQVDAGLKILNDSIIREEVQMHILSLRQRLRYFKYFINEDRLRVLTYPGSDHPTRGETVNEVGERYILNNPWKKLHKQYLAEVNVVNVRPCRSVN